MRTRCLVFLFLLVIICIFSQPGSIVAATWDIESDIGLRYANHPSIFISEDNSLVLVGGAVERDLSRKQLQRSPLELSGKLSPWNVISNSQLIYPLIWHSLVRDGENLYVAGGFNEVNSPDTFRSTETVQRAIISSTGQISEWAKISELPSKLAKGSSIVIGNIIYYAGGGVWGSAGGPSFRGNIFKAAISPDGSLGAWESAGSLPHPMLGHQLFYTGSKLYLISGYNADAGVADGKVYLASIDANGSIISWTEQVNLELPLKTYDYMMKKSGDYLIIAGGRGPQLDASQTSDEIYFSKIQNDGTIGSWQKSEIKLPKTLCCAGLTSNGTRLYLTGGHDGHDYFSNVWSIPVDAIIQTETYSSLNPLVFIPGMGASWNHDALIENNKVPNDGWSMAPYAKGTYEGMLLSLQSAGYVNEQTMYVYHYDWRNDVRFNAAALRNFINSKVLVNKPSGTKVDLVGHSMGGLVARVAASGDFSSKIDKVIALGSPFDGTVVAYNAWEGADFSGFTSAMRIGIQTLVGTTGLTYKSPVNFVQTNIPSFQNILPGWDYLKIQNGGIKKNSKLIWQNNLISEMNQNIPDKLGTIGGLGNNTLKYLTVGRQTNRDLSMGRWVDGHPVAREYSNGDDTTLIESLQVPGSWKSDALENTNHGQLCSESAGQRKVLEYLGVAGNEVVTHPRLFHRAIVVTVGSPAEFSVVTPDNKELAPEDKILALDDPILGVYRVKLESTGQGKATVYFGRINGSDTAWSENGVIFQTPGQTVEFTFSANLLLPSLGADPLSEARDYLKHARLVVSETPAVPGIDQVIKVVQEMGNDSRDKVEQWSTKALKSADQAILKIEKFFPDKTDAVLDLRMAKVKIDQYASDALAN